MKLLTGKLRYRLQKSLGSAPMLVIQNEVEYNWLVPYTKKTYKTEKRWEDATVESMQELYPQGWINGLQTGSKTS